MRGLFSRKKKEEIPDVEEPDTGKIKGDVDDDIAINDDQTGLFTGMETEDNGLFDEMESLNKNNNDINYSTLTQKIITFVCILCDSIGWMNSEHIHLEDDWRTINEWLNSISKRSHI